MTRMTAVSAILAASTALVNPAAAETELTMYYPIAVGGALTEVVDGIDLHVPPGADTRCEALLRRARLCSRALSLAGSNPPTFPRLGGRYQPPPCQPRVELTSLVVKSE